MKRKTLDFNDFYNGIVAGDRSALSKAITLVESTLEKDQILISQLLASFATLQKKTLRVGFTGTPGVGKSTLLNEIGKSFLDENFKIAILSVDPTDADSNGSILGDKTRMQDIANHPHFYIRPSCSSVKSALGKNTLNTILLCEAAGYEMIWIESVGIGQLEFELHFLVDYLVLLQPFGDGDEIQMLKKGIHQKADLVLITKADKNLLEAQNTAAGFEMNSLNQKVMICSAKSKLGVNEIKKYFKEKLAIDKNTLAFADHRNQKLSDHIENELKNNLYEYIQSNEELNKQWIKYKSHFLNNDLSAKEAIDQYLKQIFR